MKDRQLRWLVAALSAGYLTWVAVRRRLLGRVVEPALSDDGRDERIVLPLGTPNELPTDDAPDAEPEEALMTRKVGTNRRISVRGKLYGPFEPHVVGQQVEVSEQDGQLVVTYEGDEIGNFALED